MFKDIDWVAIGTMLLAIATFVVVFQTANHRRRDIKNNRIDAIRHAACATDAWTLGMANIYRDIIWYLNCLIGIEKGTVTSGEWDTIAQYYQQSIRALDKMNEKLFEINTVESGIEPMIQSIGDEVLVSINDKFNDLDEDETGEPRLISGQICPNNRPGLALLESELNFHKDRLDYYQKRKKIFEEMHSRLIALQK